MDIIVIGNGYMGKTTIAHHIEKIMATNGIIIMVNEMDLKKEEKSTIEQIQEIQNTMQIRRIHNEDFCVELTKTREIFMPRKEDSQTWKQKPIRSNKRNNKRR